MRESVAWMEEIEDGDGHVREGARRLWLLDSVSTEYGVVY